MANYIRPLYGLRMTQAPMKLTTDENPMPDTNVCFCALCGSPLTDESFGAFWYDFEANYHKECAAKVLAGAVDHQPGELAELRERIAKLEDELRTAYHRK